MTRISNKPAFWLFLVFLMGSVVVIGSEQLAYLSSLPGAWFLSVLLLAVTAIPAGLIIYRFDQFEPEPASLIAVALVWGGVIALTFGALTNSYFLGILQAHLSPITFDAWGAALVAPIDEELYKGAGLVAIYLMARSEIDGLVDGLVYGAMIGLGFQVMENVQYFLHAAAQSGGSEVGAVVGTYFVRVVLAGIYSHTLFTGLMGFGFAYAVTRKGRSRLNRYGVLALFAVLAWAAHFVWNSPWLDSLMGGSAGTFVLAIAIKGLPFVVFLVILGWFARRRERQAFDRLIAAEIGTDVLSEAEFKILERGRKRRAALRAIKRHKGLVARSLLKQLQREQMNLALLHRKVETRDHPALEAQREKIRTLRARLTTIS
jgi:RsiW-degrading membrane proteinase PrsW (M82 family)